MARCGWTVSLLRPPKVNNLVAKDRRFFLIVPCLLLVIAGVVLATAQVRHVTSRASNLVALCNPAISNSVVGLKGTKGELPLPDALRSDDGARSGIFEDDIFGTLILNQRLAVTCSEATRYRQLDLFLVFLALLLVIATTRYGPREGRWFQRLEALVAVGLGLLAAIDGPVLPLSVAALVCLVHMYGLTHWHSDGRTKT